MKKITRLIILFFLLGVIAYPCEISAQKKGHKSSNSYVYKTPKVKKSTSETYYDYGKTYKTTGYTKVKRNNTAKKEFLKQYGYKKLPNGYEVDHIRPLSEGGSDTPGNMQLLTKESHKLKTKSEKSQHKKVSVSTKKHKKSHSKHKRG